MTSLSYPSCPSLSNSFTSVKFKQETEIFYKTEPHSQFFFFVSFVWLTAGRRCDSVPCMASGYLSQNPLLTVNHPGYGHQSALNNWQSIWFPRRHFSEDRGGGGVWGQMCRGHHAPSKAAMLIPLRSPKSSPSPSQYSPSSSCSSKRDV